MGILTCLLLVFVVPSMGQNSFSNKIVLNNGIFNVSWNFNASLDTFEFLLEVRTTGWIGFGFALNAPTNMTDYDVAVGGVLSNGTTYLQDYYTTGQRRPNPEPQQDFIVINGSEQNGVTSLTFSRRRNTTDALDVAIQPGMSIFLVWAYHPSVDAQPSSFPQHSNDARGVMQQTLIPAAITPTPTPATATPAITATPVVEVRPMHFANFLQLDNNGNYNVSWVYNNSMDTLHFMVEVKTTGWIGFGVATQAPNMMMNYDVAVGGVSGGAGYLWDYRTVGRRLPQLDLQQDWNLTYSREENNVTTLRFYRQRDTNDSANDTVIQPGMSIFLVWAYHPSVDAQPSSFPQHSNDTRGVMQQTLIPAAITPTPTPATATPAITATPVVEVRPMHFVNFLQLDNNGNYNVSWVYDNTMDTLHFMVEVKTTGWIGFGVATQAPNMMMNYDVAVGGVSGGAGYLWDYRTVGRRQPQLDLQQDWNLTYSREENNVTTLRFYRQRDTNDSANDTVIQPGVSIYLVWAYHSSVDAQASSFPQHSNDTRGVMQQTLIPAAITPTPTQGPTPTPKIYQNNAIFDNGNFKVYWSYNSSADSLYFTLDVAAVGWIGFGFSENNMGMNRYDVAVGGVTNGQMYLQDYLTNGYAPPNADQQQDVNLMYAMERDGRTMISYTRKRDTGDLEGDLAIERGKQYYFIWAYHSNSDNVRQKHETQGFQRMVVIAAATVTPVITATPVVEVRPMHFANFLQLDNNGNYNVSWVYDNSMDTLHFMVEVKTTGWIGFGVATQAPNMMMNYDVAVGGVSGGAGYLWDYRTVGRRQPQLDLQQDWNLTYSREENNVTTLRFYRQRDTNDSANDTVIQPGVSIYLVWAYHSSVDAQASSFPQHSNDTRGVMKQTLIPAAITPTPTPGPTPSPKMYQNNAIFDNGNFKVYWSYNSSADSLYFTLDVAAVGWIGFGFSENNMGMNRYDVAVGGVRNGQMYLQDYITNGYAPPNADQKQDVNLMYATERDGRTMISYTRKRDTGDLDGDLAIERGKEYYFIWAYHSNSDNVLDRHETRRFQRMVVIAADVVETTPVATTGPNQGGGAGQGGGPAVEDTEQRRLEITILLAVSLGLIVVSLILLSMGLAYFCRVMNTLAAK